MAKVSRLLSFGRWSRSSLGASALVLIVAATHCADSSTTRVVPVRGTLGREIFGVLCDRVAANSLREDLTGASFQALCHPDAAGKYATSVDTSLLPPFDPNAVDVKGQPVPVTVQQQQRAHNVGRVEALGRDRESLVAAFDATIPVRTIPLLDLGAKDAAATCSPGAPGPLDSELGAVISRMNPMENDRTIPLLTEAIANVLNGIKASPDAQASLAKFSARAGYRPAEEALGLVRPALSYPQLPELARTLLKLVATDSDPLNPAGAKDPSKPLSATNRKPIPGPLAGQLQSLLHIGYEELRTATPSSAVAPLRVTPDPLVPSRQILSRPRTNVELAREILLASDSSFDTGNDDLASRYAVTRDMRGVAAVSLVDGGVPAPFLDVTGPNGLPDGLPDIDENGQFVAAPGGSIPSPFFSLDGKDGPRDTFGRALGAAKGPLYAYLDAEHTFMGGLESDLFSLLDPVSTHGHETVMYVAEALPALAGARDPAATSTKTYAADPSLATDWQLAHGMPAPPGLGTAPVVVSYQAYRPDTSPLLDLLYAAGQVVADPVTDDLLQLVRRLAAENPNQVARLAGLGLQIKAIADKHPEAHIPAASTFWDDVIDTIVPIVQVQDTLTPGGGILEDLLLAFEQAPTVQLQGTLAAYANFRDELTYNHHGTAGADLLNGPAFNLTTGNTGPLQTPIDRTEPDTANNRSALQRFMQLLHDANGLGACTKDGAIAPISWNGINLHYPPQSVGEHLVLDPVCLAFTGKPAPSHLDPCGILRIENVDALLLDVALNRAHFDIQDACLGALVNSPLTGIVGGTDAFLQSISGINGFDTHPTVAGVGRLVYFDTAGGPNPEDKNPATLKTLNFIEGVLDPVPSMVCPAAPYTSKDGTVVNLRKCTSPDDTLRARDPGYLMALEQFNFVPNVAYLAASFDDHKKPLYFVDLVNALHLHWGSPAQPKAVCDPTLPKSDFRWCTQDGAVTYEPLLVDVLANTEIFQAIHDLITILDHMQISHCDATNGAGVCTHSTPRTGVQVLANAVRVLVDPARNVGLKDRHGNQAVARNDGTMNPQVTPLYLLMDAFKGFDAAFTAYASAHPNDAARQEDWKMARSQLTDQFLAVNGSGASATFANPKIIPILPTLIDTLMAQILANCPDRSSRAACTWATTDVTRELSDIVAGPVFAAGVDFLDAVRANTTARTALEQFGQYLLSPASPNEAQLATLSSIVDGLEVLDDTTDLSPFFNVVAPVLSSSLVNDHDEVVRRGAFDGAVEVLSRLFAQGYAPHGEDCSVEIDPNHAITYALTNAVTPMGANDLTPLERFIDAVTDVNRADPTQTNGLGAKDFANIANEVSVFCLDPASGLEQIYEVIRQATGSN